MYILLHISLHDNTIYSVKPITWLGNKGTMSGTKLWEYCQYEKLNN